MIRMVLIAAFDPSLERVVLIVKKTPEWQAGHLNLVGGKLEVDEEPEEAAYREFEEETGVTLPEHSLVRAGVMVGDDWEVTVFRTATDLVENCYSAEEEEIVLRHVREDSVFDHSLRNVPALIQLCRAQFTDSPNQSMLAFQLTYQ